MTEDQLIKLREEIVQSKIEPKEAGEILFSNKTRAWRTKEWKKKRDKLIKDRCEQCGSKEVLTLQHTCHPRDYGTIKKEICIKYGQLINEKYPLESLVNEKEVVRYFKKNIDKEERDVCPSCSSINISLRKTLSPKYKCNRCKGLFEAPIRKIIPIFIDDRKEGKSQEVNTITFSSLEWKIYKEKSRELLFEEYGEQIEKEILITTIDEYLRYISLEDTVTFCKKCAFLWDKKHMNLCPICKIKYKMIYHKTCYDCRKKLMNSND